jgi:hypothetical protein
VGLRGKLDQQQSDDALPMMQRVRLLAHVDDRKPQWALVSRIHVAWVGHEKSSRRFPGGWKPDGRDVARQVEALFRHNDGHFAGLQRPVSQGSVLRSQLIS